MRKLPVYLAVVAGLMVLLALIDARAAGVASGDVMLPDTVLTQAEGPDTAATLLPDVPKMTDRQRRRRRINDAVADTADNQPGDSASAPSGVADTAHASSGPRIVRMKIDLDNPVDFQSSDSIAMEGTNKAYLYGKGEVTYGKIKLNADQIDMDINTSMVYAVGRADSTGEVIGTPVFDDNGQSYESKTMTYNFDTGRGYITDVITQQGEGYLTGGLTKKVEDNVFYTQNGRYTTCDNHEHPHFYMQLTKAKIRPGKDIVTGPAYMVLAGLPLPLAVPFGYFPFSEKYSSGVIFPTFGDDYNRGFYLSNGGYYFAFNDNIDLALTGEIYTKGSWGLQARSAYVKRYRYSGNLSASYLKTILGDKGSADYSVQTNMQVLWSHTQDQKANPNLTFSASVNFTTSGYSRNDLNSYYNSSFTENTKSSTINATWRPAGTKWSISANMNLSQRTQDSTLTVGFPSLTATYSQFFPFKRKNSVGKERWYEKIKMSYSGQFNNSLTAKQNEFFKKSLIKDWSNGMRHNIPISATFTALKYFNITPQVTINDRMYSTKVRRQWDPNASAEVMDTSYSLYNVFDFNASVGVETKVYGFYRPWKIFGNKVKMIRHVISPSVSFSYTPDFSDPMWGIYGTYERPNADGSFTRQKYSMFPGSLFGVPSQGMSGTVNYKLSNNLEMKVRQDADSVGEEVEDKKISLIENLSVNQSYNFAADSLRFSNINAQLMLKLASNFNLTLNSTWDVYTYALNPQGTPVRVNKLRLTEGKGLGRLSSTGTSFSYTFNNAFFKKLRDRWSGKKSDKGKGSGGKGGSDESGGSDSGSSGGAPDDGGSSSTPGGADADGYLHWDCPWSLSVNYSIAYGYGDFNKEKMEYNGKFTQNLSFSGSLRPTPNWDFSFSASYDFNAKKIAYMNCNVSRNLHCFTMTASFIPVGPYKSYNFHIAVTSSLLSDLKYDKRSSLSNGVNWY